MKLVTLNIQFNDLSESKQQELQEILEALCQDTDLAPGDDGFELCVEVTFSKAKKTAKELNKKNKQ